MSSDAIMETASDTATEQSADAAPDTADKLASSASSHKSPSSPESLASASPDGEFNKPHVSSPDPGFQPAPCPFVEASWISKVTLWWMTSLMRLGYKRPLVATDVCDVRKCDKTDTLIDGINRQLSLSSDRTSHNPVLLWMRKEAVYIVIYFFGYLSMEMMKLTQPVLIGYVVSYLSDEDIVSSREAYMYGAGSILIALSFSLPYTLGSHLCFTLCTRVRALMTTLIYNKVLKCSLKSLDEYTAGHVMNLAATDVEVIYKGVLYSIHLVLSPLICLAATTLLFVEFGKSFIAGFIIFIILFCIEIFSGLRVGAYRKDVGALADKRDTAMTEIIRGISMVKIFCLEKYYSSVIHSRRKAELGKIRSARLWEAQLMAVYYACNKVICLATVVTYVLLGNTLSAGQAIKLLGWLEALRIEAFGMFPLAVITAAEGHFSAKRIMEFLGTGEMTKSHEDVRVNKTKSHENGKHNNSKSHKNIKHTISKSPENIEHIIKAVVMTKFTTTWGCKQKGQKGVEINTKHLSNGKTDPSFLSDDQPEEQPFHLSDITLSIKKGSLVAVVGEVGSGKSSLLMSIIGEMSETSGELKVIGRTAYVPQQAWLFSQTLRENILIGREKNQRYDHVIKACGLSQDISEMPDGDLTRVGERGWSLSGGQKIRVSLARAVYQDSDLYLLDDPLSSLDSKVGKQVFNMCIKSVLKDKTRILVTHQLQYLPQVDYVYIMNKGEIVAEGLFDDLQHEKAYMELLIKRQTEGKEPPGEELLDSHCRIPRDYSGSDVETSVRNNAVDDLPHSNQRKMSTSSTKGDKHSLQGADLEVMSRGLKRGHSRTSQRSTQHRLPDDNTSPTAEKVLFAVDDQDLDRTGIPRSVLLSYMKAGNGHIYVPVITTLLVLVMTLQIGGDWLLLQSARNMTSRVNASNTIIDDVTEDSHTFLLVYGLSILLLVLLADAFNVSYMMFSTVAGKYLHKNMFAKVIRSPLSFFETNQAGKVLNRFTRDLGFVDGMLARELSQLGSLLIGVLVFICVSNVIIIALCIPVVVALIILRQYSIYSLRELRRLEAACRSPLYSHMMDTIEGLPVIRALDKEDHFRERFYHLQDRHTSAWFLYINAQRWMGVRAEWTVALFLTACLLIAFLTDNDDGENVSLGLGLAYIVNLVVIMQYFLRMSAEAETMMTSVERIVQYNHLDQEAPWVAEVVPPDTWPDQGHISLKDVSLRYPGQESLALRDVTLTVKAREKVGVVGRTGAGKSSLLACFLRMVEPDGLIQIDGVDITKIGLHHLRSSIAVIPQDPILIEGTLRKNLDPASEHTDLQLWDCLEKVCMKLALTEEGFTLYSDVTGGGTNFSVGQRQLLCLSRALLRHSCILLVDEATAHVDQKTDSLVQETIRNEFKQCTVITIAHRLQTIIDADKVLVLSSGQVVEFDQPVELLEKIDSAFYYLVEQTGQLQQLTAMALAARKRRISVAELSAA